MLKHILAEARRHGHKRLSLKYESIGFQRCGPFGDYKPDPHSVFMALVLQGQT
jgi:putative acetyltransferase